MCGLEFGLRQNRSDTVQRIIFAIAIAVHGTRVWFVAYSLNDFMSDWLITVVTCPFMVTTCPPQAAVAEQKNN